MKNILIAVLLMLLSNILIAQSLNWNSIEESSAGQIYLNLGFDFGATVQFGYAHKLKFNKQVVLLTDFSVPMGNKLNDFKFRVGAQMRIFENGDFKTSIEYLSVIRRNETNLVRQIGIGQVGTLTGGFYKEKWHVAFDIGFDSSVATHLKHSDEMQEVYSDIQNAWFTNTAGYWHYGLQSSRKLGERMELNLSVGATNARGKDVDALLPIYANIGAVFFLH